MIRFFHFFVRFGDESISFPPLRSVRRLGHRLLWLRTILRFVWPEGFCCVVVECHLERPILVCSYRRCHPSMDLLSFAVANGALPWAELLHLWLLGGLPKVRTIRSEPEPSILN